MALPGLESMNRHKPQSPLHLLAILAVVAAWFSPWWIGGRVLAPLDLQNLMMSPWKGSNTTEYAENHIIADGVDQYLVYRLIAERDFKREGTVAWSSLTYGGVAQHANTMALYGDWTMQLHRWFDFWTAWHVGLIGQVLFAAFGMYVFLRGRGLLGVWSVCGALAYAANSQFITWLYHRWALGSFCWVPWILWAIDRHRHGDRRAGWLVPLFICAGFLGGTLQHAALVALAVMAMWLEEAIQARPGKRRTDGSESSQAKLLARYLVWGMLGAGLGAMVLLPCTDAFLTSNRLGLHTGSTANAANSIYPQGLLQPLFNLAAYPLQVFPSILGRCDSVDLLKLFKSDLFYVSYFGFLPVLVAYLCVWRKDTPALARILMVAGLLLPLTPLVRPLYQRLLLLFIIGGIFAFAWFMQTSAPETKRRFFKWISLACSVAAGVWLSASAVLATRTEFVASLRERVVDAGRGSSFGHFGGWLEMRAANFTNDLFIWSPQHLWPLVLAAIGLAGLRLTAASSNGKRRTGAWLICLAVVCEVTLFSSRWVVWSDPVKHPMFAETLETRVLHEEVGRDGRVTTVTHPTAHMVLTPFAPNTLAPYRIATICGYDSIIPDGMILPTAPPDDAARLGRFGVSHLVTWKGNDGIPAPWSRVWSGDTMDLYQNPLAVPRYAGFAGDESRDGFLSGRSVQLVRLNETTGLENKRRIEVPADVRWIRIAENRADGWQYRRVSEGTWRDLPPSPEKCMWIPADGGDVEMRYQPPLRRDGAIISCGSLAVVLAGLAWSQRRQTPQSLNG